MHRTLGLVLCGVAIVAVSWVAGRRGYAERTEPAWTEVAPGVYRSPGTPASHALVKGDRALLIDAAAPPDGLLARGVRQLDGVLLTHHHRDSLAALDVYLGRKVPVRAPKASLPWLSVDGVISYWKEAIPLRSSRTAYLVLPQGVSGVDGSLEDGQVIDWGDWSLRVIAAPGHAPDHVAFLAEPKTGGKRVLFAGDALAAAGKLWSPYTTDWDHWTDAGLKPAAQALRQLARLKPDIVLPAHGEPIAPPVGAHAAVRALEQAASAVEEVAFLKSYERFTRERLKDPPSYAFLAKDQAGSNGSKPWSRLAPHLWLTGNTFVLQSREGPVLVVDPWDPHSARQIPKLQKDEGLGRVEVVLCSHAHFDHYDGAYSLFERDKPQVWTLDRVAAPIADPYRLRAPFLDARPLTVHRRFADGEVGRWREYSLRFHFLPGQSLFTMGVETTIDGRKCLFTADNFFHHDLYSGTGGWMGLNRSGPLLYAQSARKVLDISPDWVLAEHGSAMEFNAADFRRRVEWGEAGARAASAVCLSGDYRHDWNPHHVRVEPLLQLVAAGTPVRAELVIDNVLGRARTLRVSVAGRGRFADQTFDVRVDAGATVRRPLELKLTGDLPPRRHVFAVTARDGEAVEPGDAFLALEAEKAGPSTGQPH